MKHVSAFLNEKKDMYYRMVLTYNFSVDEARLSFEELVEKLSFEKVEDQSTYALPFAINKKSKDVIDPIVKWSEDKSTNISGEDFVQLFYWIIDKTNDGKTKLASKYLQYNLMTNGHYKSFDHGSSA